MPKGHGVGRAYHGLVYLLRYYLVAPVVRVLTFVSKELRLLLKQRPLLGSLVLGPFLILLTFGLTFRGRQPELSTVLVVPPTPEVREWVDTYVQRPTPGFRLVERTDDEDYARRLLLSGAVDVVLVIPEGMSETIESGQHVRVKLIHDAVDPTQQDWITYNTYVFFSELNRRVVADVVRSTGYSPLPPDVLVAPFQPEIVNLARIRPSYVGYYAPGVLALLIQHLGITLGALSLIRERLLGSVEVFRVAPVSASEILVGKSLAYAIVLLGLAAVLIVVMLQWLGVPDLGPLGWLASTLALLTLASLGVGLAISALSSTEHQAVQFAMLTLLASVFFSGFFVPLSTFYPAAGAIASVLPVTHGVASLQSLMLKDEVPSVTALVALGLIALVSYFYTAVRFRRQLRLD